MQQTHQKPIRCEAAAESASFFGQAYAIFPAATG
jgi:hypothetical protein